MSEYIVEVSELVIDANGNHPFGKGEGIVRCKDCEFGAYEGEECMRIDEWDDSLWFSVDPDGFCSWGERRES